MASFQHVTYSGGELRPFQPETERASVSLDRSSSSEASRWPVRGLVPTTLQEPVSAESRKQRVEGALACLHALPCRQFADEVEPISLFVFKEGHDAAFKNAPTKFSDPPVGLRTYHVCIVPGATRLRRGLPRAMSACAGTRGGVDNVLAPQRRRPPETRLGRGPKVGSQVAEYRAFARGNIAACRRATHRIGATHQIDLSQCPRESVPPRRSRSPGRSGTHG